MFEKGEERAGIPILGIENAHPLFQFFGRLTDSGGEDLLH